MKLPRIQQYEAKGYVSGFEGKAQVLFSRCFGGRQFNSQMWNWQFNENPCLKRRITTLWDNDILIALTALTPSNATFEGNTVKCAVSGTTMARDDYRGVSIQLVQESGNQNQDIEFKYSFPNRQAFRIATEFYGHHYVGDIAFWMIKPYSILTDDCIDKIDSFSEEHGELYKKLINDHLFIKNRDVDYLNWRFVKKPESGYEIYQLMNDSLRGYLVINVFTEGEEKHLQIIDIVADSTSNFKKLIEFAIQKGFEKEVDYIKLWMTSKKYSIVLEEMGFEYGRQPFRMTVWDRDIDLEKAYITLSDSDVF